MRLINRLCRSHWPTQKRLCIETLEDRRMLAVLTVDTDRDIVDSLDNATSLREAILAANAMPGRDEIVFDFGHGDPATIRLELGELVLADAVTIEGNGPELLTIDAQQKSRVAVVTAESGDFAFTRERGTGTVRCLLGRFSVVWARSQSPFLASVFTLSKQRPSSNADALGPADAAKPAQRHAKQGQG